MLLGIPLSCLTVITNIVFTIKKFQVIKLWVHVTAADSIRKSIANNSCKIFAKVLVHSILVITFAVIINRPESRDGPNLRFSRSRRFGLAHRTSAERSAECYMLG